ncbi:MAG: thioredoxin family protein [Candidatus Obscuribacterales bacterium]|jgi:thioredoxin 1|nr:thioredoxin family protein [Candidatus Obscuribacterales bacterium]
MKTKIKRILTSCVIAALAGSFTYAKAENPYPQPGAASPNNQVSAAGVIAPQAQAMQSSPYGLAQQQSGYAPMPVPTMQSSEFLPQANAPAPYSVAPQSAPPATAATKMATAVPSELKGPYVRVYEFGARWCPSCRQLKPIVHDTMEKYKGFAEFNYVDTDKNPDLVRQLSIMQIPQVIIVDRRGRMLNRLVGYEHGIQLDPILTNYKQQIQAKQQPPQ